MLFLTTVWFLNDNNVTQVVVWIHLSLYFVHLLEIA